MRAVFERNDKTDSAMLCADDLFRIAVPRSPQVAPDGGAVLYICEQPDITTDRVARQLHVVDRVTRADRVSELSGDVVFARWQGDAAVLAVVDDVDAGAVRVVYVPRTGGDAVIVGDLPSLPSQIAVSRDGARLALVMTVPSPLHAAAMPDQPPGARWSPRARYIDRAVWRVDGSGEVTGTDQVFVMDLADGDLRQATTSLVATPLFPGGIAWSADGAQIYFSSNLDPGWAARQWDSHLHALDVASGAIVQLTRGAGADTDPVVSPDGDWIAYLGFDDTGQFHHAPSLRIMRRDGSEQRVLADVGQNIGAHGWCADGSGLMFSFVRDAAQHLARVGLCGALTPLFSPVGADRPFGVEPYLAGAAAFEVTADGVAVVVTGQGDPGQVAFVGFDGRHDMLTSLNADWLPQLALGRVDRIDYPAPDGMMIQAWLVYPPDYDPQQRYPLLLNIHGGPNLAYGDNFSFRFQRYAAEGYVVLLVNYRGSVGADMGFYQTPSQFPDKEYEDLIAGVDAAIDHAVIDPARVFITGLSAGGALTAWAIGKTRRFAAAAVHSPIINWLSHTMTNDLYGSYTDRSFTVLPWEDPLAYWQRSPLSLVAAMTTPTLIIHGECDSRTPPGEGIQLYHALQMRGVATALVMLPGAFHVPTRPTQWIEEQQFILEWFAKYPLPSIPLQPKDDQSA